MMEYALAEYAGAVVRSPDVSAEQRAARFLARFVAGPPKQVQKEVADQLHVGQSTISKWLRYRHVPADRLGDVSALVGVPVAQFYEHGSQILAAPELAFEPESVISPPSLPSQIMEERHRRLVNFIAGLPPEAVAEIEAKIHELFATWAMRRSGAEPSTDDSG
jgi:transcriptional regulator with XRE-family HTH domain